MGLTTPCNDYTNHSNAWEKTRDVAEGALAIKRKGTRYLPKGKMTDTDYGDYLDRSIFVGYVDKILDFSVGQLLRNPPQTVNIPDEILKDVDLCGNSLSEFINNIARELMLVERIGVWFDYGAGKDRPYMVSVKSENIIKWHYGYNSSGEKVLKSVVLKTAEDTVNPITYDIESEDKYICLYLNEEGVFQKDTYSKAKESGEDVTCTESDIPLAGIGGKPLDFIPFKIICAKGTPEEIHTAPMFPIAEVNLSLYRSMASREQLLYYYGMPTLMLKDYSESAVAIGGIIKVGPTGDGKFLQVAVEDAVEKAIISKKEEIAQLGSSFLSGRGRYVASAATSDNNQEGDNASLSAIANTISHALTDIFTSMMIYGYDGLVDPAVTVNTEFEEPELSQGELTEFGNEVASGRMSFSTLFHNLQRNKIYPSGWTEEQERAAIDETAKWLANNRTQIPGMTFNV